MKLSTTDKQWHKWGKKNPYLGVLGYESSSMNHTDVENAFFATGEAHIAEVINNITHHFGGISDTSQALDFGCGVGRLVLPLSHRFDRVTGVDISPKMIEEARNRVPPNSRIDFFERLSEIEPNRRYNLVHSYIVIQHIRTKQGYQIISKLLDLVAPGGFFALHMTVGDLNKTRRIFNALRYHLPPLHWAYNIVRKRPWDEPITEMNRYDLARLMQLMRGRYDGTLAFRDFDQNGHVGVMIIGKSL